jgi:transcriptional regulator with XRE-family HTH domain
MDEVDRESAGGVGIVGRATAGAASVQDVVGTALALSGLSGREFGRLMGVSEMTVNRWEQGRAAPRARHLRRMGLVRELALGMEEKGTLEGFYEELLLAPDPVEVWRRAMGEKEMRSEE